MLAGLLVKRLPLRKYICLSRLDSGLSEPNFISGGRDLGRFGLTLTDLDRLALIWTDLDWFGLIWTVFGLES